MRLHLLLMALFCGAVGCAEPTQTVILDPASAARLAARYGSRVEIVPHERALWPPVHGHVTAPAPDQVAVRIQYQEGDEIPGVGVVRKGMSTGLMITGAVVLALGTAVTIGSVVGANFCPPQPSGSMSLGFNFGRGACTLSWGIAGAFGGATAITGLVMLIQGLTPTNLYLDRSARVSVAPVVQRNGGGAALQWQF